MSASNSAGTMPDDSYPAAVDLGALAGECLQQKVFYRPDYIGVVVFVWRAGALIARKQNDFAASAQVSDQAHVVFWIFGQPVVQQYYQTCFFERRAGRFENLIALMIDAAFPGGHRFMTILSTSGAFGRLNRAAPEFSGGVSLRQQSQQKHESNGKKSH